MGSCRWRVGSVEGEEKKTTPSIVAAPLPMPACVNHYPKQLHSQTKNGHIKKERMRKMYESFFLSPHFPRSFFFFRYQQTLFVVSLGIMCLCEYTEALWNCELLCCRESVRTAAMFITNVKHNFGRRMWINGITLWHKGRCSADVADRNLFVCCLEVVQWSICWKFALTSQTCWFDVAVRRSAASSTSVTHLRHWRSL